MSDPNTEAREAFDQLRQSASRAYQVADRAIVRAALAPAPSTPVEQEATADELELLRAQLVAAIYGTEGSFEVAHRVATTILAQFRVTPRG